MADQCHTVSTTNIKDVPRNTDVDITYSFDDNGILKVTVTSANDKTRSFTVSEDKLNPFSFLYF